MSCYVSDFIFFKNMEKMEIIKDLNKGKRQPEITEVFNSFDTRKSVDRVIKYLSYFYFNCSNKPQIDKLRENSVIEEFCLLMHTVEALQSETALCRAILDHSSGKMSDDQIKAVLSEYLETHTFIYLPEERICKKGDSRFWDRKSQLYLLTDGKDSHVCNPVQRELLIRIEKEKTFRTVRL